ncbi:hypothetical protein [Polluticoccus soli]|uniref:hypothetical protein n=1 Tax=Polluticoccus soli TaxID=3034150 RepID=UPI0023E11664|nr:hypothetical protein [Flavipsychrobacter sp. JY13-12]
MKKVMKGLVAGMCVIIAGYTNAFAENKLTNNEIPADNATGVVSNRPNMGIKLIETNNNPFAQKNLVVEMRDVMGKYIYTSGAAATVNGQPAIDVDIPQLAKGVYSYAVYDEKDNIIAIGKYVKE